MITPKQIQIGILVAIIVAISVTGFFTYRFVDGMVTKIGNLSTEVVETKSSLSHMTAAYNAQNESIQLIETKVKEVEELREVVRQQETRNANRIKNIQMELFEMRNIVDDAEYSTIATQTLRKRLRCLEVAANSRKDEGGECE